MKSISFDQLNDSDTYPNVRFTKTKCAITGTARNGPSRECIEVTKAKFGKFKIKWRGRIPVPTKETERCSLGHHHQVDKDEMWVWNYTILGASEAKDLAYFLLERL